MVVAVVLAALAYGICAALGLPTSVALVSALLVLLTGLPSAGFGFGERRSRSDVARRGGRPQARAAATRWSG